MPHSGKILWKRQMEFSRSHKHPKNSWASSTPALDGERVYVVFADSSRQILAAYDFEGNSVWEQNLGSFKSQHAQGTSPIVFEDMVILANDQDGPSSIVGLRQTDRPHRVERAAQIGSPIDVLRDAVYLPSETGAAAVDLLEQPIGGFGTRSAHGADDLDDQVAAAAHRCLACLGRGPVFSMLRGRRTGHADGRSRSGRTGGRLENPHPLHPDAAVTLRSDAGRLRKISVSLERSWRRVLHGSGNRQRRLDQARGGGFQRVPDLRRGENFSMSMRPAT